MEIDLKLNDNDNNNKNNKPAVILPSSGPGAAIPSASVSASISAPSSFKHKYSALDDDGSILASSLNSLGKKQKPHSCATAIGGVKTSLEIIGSSIRDMPTEHKLC
jgi:hypothetical protein